MVKSKDEIISEFNILTNMSVDELQDWVENPQSKKAGTGVGLKSAHKIMGILKKNPSKDPELYDEEDIEHMRKVVAYDKRHLAQEGHLKDNKPKEELENAKSTISLKNWGHDPLKSSETDGSTPAEHAETEEDAPAQDSAETSTAEEPEKATDKKTGEKRKLEDKEEEEEEVEAVDAEGVDEEPEQDELDGEEARARKKSKTDGVAHEDEVKA